jgi:hypothetical protein
MQILERYFAALRTQDWESLGACLAENVHRTGPYLDVVQGRSAYVAFLARVIPALRSYDLRVSRVRELGGASAVAEISEFADVNGVRKEFPEVLLFDFDADGSILRIDIYIKQPPS